MHVNSRTRFRQGTLSITVNEEVMRIGYETDKGAKVARTHTYLKVKWWSLGKRLETNYW